MDIHSAHTIYQTLFNNIRQVIKGKDEVIRQLLCAFFCGGHVLLEDVPGTGKTTLAKTLARSLGTDTKRVQFTPDLLPSDILGVSVYSQQQGSFHFRKGPVFTNILLADEINRANPRTQSALLEAMAEKQISIEGTRYALDRLFFVIATENPVESHGTYPLPESQMDRFMIRLTPGYVTRDEEVEILSNQLITHPLFSIEKVADEQQVFKVMDAVKQVNITEELMFYIVDLVTATRQAEHVELGASPRASLSLVEMARARALTENRDYVIPEDIQEIAVPVIGHRLQLLPQAGFSGISSDAIVKKIIKNLKVPV